MIESPASAFARLAVRARTGGFPDEARSLAVDGITDCIGCLFAGAAQPVAQKIATIIARGDEPHGSLVAPCPVIGGYTTPADAALFGATLAHALDYDDVNYPGLTHPSTIIVPALLAASSFAPHLTGRNMITGYICGVELLGKIGAVLNPQLFERGWHPTPTLGPPTVAFAVAGLLGLPQAQTVNALGIAVSASAGLRANFGTMTKPLHAGQASRAGLVAVILAREGFTASPDAIEHAFGYFSLFGSGPVDPVALASPGCPLEILTDRGLEIKPYPACAAGQPAIEAAIELHAMVNGRHIDHIVVRTGEPTMLAMIHDRPADPLQGKFSLPFCVAAGLARGDVRIDTFSDSGIADPAIVSLIDRITVEVDDARRLDYYFGVDITVILSDGKCLHRQVPRARGTVARRLPDEDLHRKFRDCALQSVDEERATELFVAFRALDSTVEVARLAALVAG